MTKRFLNGLRNVHVSKYFLLVMAGLIFSPIVASNDDNRFEVQLNQRSSINDCNAVAPESTSANKGKWTEIPWAPTNIRAGDNFSFVFCVTEQEITDAIIGYVSQRNRYRIPVAGSTHYHWLARVGCSYELSNTLKASASAEHYEAIDAGRSYTFRVKISGVH